jgi:hypothetical protein
VEASARGKFPASPVGRLVDLSVTLAVTDAVIYGAKRSDVGDCSVTAL